jgi:replicative DNA helicase
MADFARGLVTKIVLEEDLQPTLSAGVRADWFEDPETQKVYSWVLEYFNRYGKTPSRQALKAEYPTYTLVKVPEPYEYYVDKFVAQRHRAILMDTVIDVNEALDDDDHKKAQDLMSQGLMRIGSELSTLTDVNAVEDWGGRYEFYDESRQTVGELTGIPTGFPTFDMLTGGFHDSQFILFGGAQKQGKSWMMMKAAVAAQEFAKKVLFITFEMSQREQLARYDAMTCGLDSNKVLRGTLTDVDMTKLHKGMSLRKNMEPFIISSDISATTTVTGMAGKIDEYQPDIVFIDGCYLMENEIGAQSGTPQAYTAISRSLKRLAQRIDKPVVGSTQASQSKMGKDNQVTMNSFMWSNAWAQDADMMIGAERVGDAPLFKVRIVGGRNVSPYEIEVTANFNESLFEELDTSYDNDDD